MTISEYTPSAPLQPYIKSFKIIESHDAIVNRVMPNTSFALAFRLSGKIAYVNGTGETTLPAATFTGLRKTVRIISYAPISSALIVQFNETGTSAFFKHPLYELFGESVSLDDYFPQSEISILEERLAEADTDKLKISVVENFLCSKLVDFRYDPLIVKSIASIHTHRGNLKIKTLANDLYISQDAFEKRFRRVTGASPKQFATIVKLNHIIQQCPRPVSSLDMALCNGYYDQAHFIKDFKTFTGLTPNIFFKSASFW